MAKLIIKNPLTLFLSTMRTDGNNLIVTAEDVEIIEEEEVILDGLLDENGVQLASWDELVNDYGLDVEKTYAEGTGTSDPAYSTATSSLYYILTNNEEFSTATELVIPNTVTKISSYSLVNGQFKTIRLTNSVKSIGSGAFESISHPSKIESVYFNGTIEDWCNITFTNGTSNPMSCSNAYFYIKYTEITDIQIPNTITKIKDYTFYHFWNITSISIPESVKSIGVASFMGCTNLTNVSIPEGVTNIEERAFYNCTSLKEVNIPNGVTVIKNNLFYKCSSLETLIIPDSVTTIELSAFGQMPGVIHLPNTLQSIVDPFGDFETNVGCTFTIYFHYSATDEVLFDTSKVITQGTSKKTYTYNIYTDNGNLADALFSKANSYTIVNMYHLDGTEWS